MAAMWSVVDPQGAKSAPENRMQGGELDSEGPGAQRGIIKGPVGIQAGRESALPQQVKQEPSEEHQQFWEAQLQSFVQALESPHSDGSTSRLLQSTSRDNNTEGFLPLFGAMADFNPLPRVDRMAQLPPGNPSGEFQQMDKSPFTKETVGSGAMKEEAPDGEPITLDTPRQQFRSFRYWDSEGPQEVCQRLRELCCLWLKPESRSKEEIVELVVLEQFLTILPKEMQSRMRTLDPETCSQAVALAEGFGLRQQRQEERKTEKVEVLEQDHFSKEKPAPLNTWQKPIKQEDGRDASMQEHNRMEQPTREMDHGSEGEDIPAKKSKKSSCKYLEKWDSEITFLKRSRMGTSHAFCKICNCDFSVSHGGRHDVSQHEKSAKHKRLLEAQKHDPTVSAFVTRNSTEADQVINAEVKMAMLCAKNSISFTFCDDFNKCVAEMFPDSTIARKYAAGKTKTMQIIKGAIAAELDEELAKICRSQPFSLMCDESNNRKTDKEFVILTRIYDEATMQVATRFLEMPICNVGNAENLYEKLSEALRKRGIPWENLTAFNSDNVSVMKGRHNSVISRLKTSQPHVQDLGCICHLAQLATGYAIRALPVPLEDILVGIYTHFDKSAKRCEIDKEFIDFTDSDHLKLLRYCSTTWLSLLTCIQRVLNQWDPLQAYFNSLEEVERSAKVHDLASHLRDPVVKVFFMFLTAALKPLSEFNIAFQSEGVQIHRLEEEMYRLIRRILGYLIPARAIVGVPLREVEYGEGHQLADEELFIGADTKAFMKRTELPVSAKKEIFQFVRRFYEAALQKMFSSFPLDHPLLSDLKVLDPAARLDITPGTVERLGALFPLLSLREDRLREELIDYQVTDSKQLPQEDKIDRFWGLLGKDVKFSELPRLMKALLCIPHSNASSERVFTMVRKIVTENRMSLDNCTVCALLLCKINHSGPAHEYIPSKKVLKDAKSATNLYNMSSMN